MDWDNLRVLVEVLRCRSLSTAARRLGVNQSTVGRRLEALEAALQVRLVQRGRDGAAPTVAGRAISLHLERVEAEMRAIERELGGFDLRLEGMVQVAAPVGLAVRVIAASLAALRARHPGIVVQIRCQADMEDAAHTLDVLLQWHRFAQPELIARRVASVPFALYASAAYLAEHGQPELAAGCAGHFLVTFAGADAGWMEWLARHACAAHVALRTDTFEAQLAAAQRGAGLALLPRFMADRCRDLVRIETASRPPAGEIWLGLRPERRAIPRVRLVADQLREWVARETLPPAERGCGPAETGSPPALPARGRAGGPA